MKFNLKQQIAMHNARLGKDLLEKDYIALPRSYIEIIQDALISMSYDYNIEAIKEIINYLEGLK